MIYVELLHNLAALIALSILSFFIDSRWHASTRTGAILQGLLFGAGSILVMLSPVNFPDGVIFDARSVGLSLVALYFGPISALMATIITIAGRIMIGGAGLLAGSITILISVSIGLIFYNRRRLVIEPPSVPFLYSFGLLVHAVVLSALYFTLPEESAMATLGTIALPMMVTYPVATLLLGKILSTLVRIRVDLFALSKGKTFFQSLFREHSAVKLLFDADTGQITEANDAAIRYYGWSPEEMKRMRIQDINILSPGEIETEMRRAKDMEKNHFTFKHRRNDGSIRDVDVYSSPMHIDGRDYLYSIIHDVTERMRSEEQLHLQISALNSASNAIVITDTDGAIIWANNAFTKVTGFHTDEAVGKNPRELVKSGIQPKPYYTQMWDTILRGDVWKGELVNKRKDGSQYYEEMTITPVNNKKGDITHFIAIKQDITERKTSENLLMEKLEELKKTNAELDRFVYSTSHDLRAPLLSVLGLIELSREATDPNSETMSYLDMMRDGIRRSDDTIKQILAYSRNSRMKPLVEPIDLRALIEHHVQDIRHMKEAEHIRFEIDLPEDSLLQSDPMRVRVILQNLITNAVKYQRLDEPSPWVKIQMRYNGSDVVISVEDNGEGIPEDRISAIFEMFQRNSNLSSGSGLGLYLVREMTTRLGGRVDVTSIVGQGSRFVITLPNAQNAIA
jgi:PAS domain S-box-containing protein